MTFWVAFLPVKDSSSSFGAWYFLLPTSLVIIAVLSIRFASSKGYKKLLVLGQLIQLLIINAWYIAARHPCLRLSFYHSHGCIDDSFCP